MTNLITRRSALTGLAGGLAWAATARAQGVSADGPPDRLLFENVRIFDGKGDALRDGHLLIEGDRISAVSTSPIGPLEGVRTIDGGGRVLMPGLTDAHWHAVMAATSFDAIQTADPGYTYGVAIAEAERTLMRGFTTIRDMAGATLGLQRAIDEGLVPGPRIFPSGAFVSQSSGHGDLLAVHEMPKTLEGADPAQMEQFGHFMVANGEAEVLAAVRQQLKRGASQIKIGAGGGYSTEVDPLDSIQYTLEEQRAAVRAARDWRTYVAAHVYHPAGTRRALDAGVLSIEHGQLLDEETVALIAEREAWLSTQPFGAADGTPADHETGIPESLLGTWPDLLGWARQHGTRVAFGTDLLFNRDAAAMQNEMLTRFAEVYSNAETLRIATSGNCELFAMSGPRNPYKDARLGVLEEGAWADMILVDGDPLADIEVLRRHEDAFVMIVKNGRVHKDLLGGPGENGPE